MTQSPPMQPPKYLPSNFLAIVLAGLSLGVAACATASPPNPAEPETALVGDAPAPLAAAVPSAETSTPGLAPTAPAAAPTCQMFSASGALLREPLRRLIDAGLARWLQGVEGDRVLGNHRFLGWLVKSLYPGDPCYQRVDLHAGDIVQKVNGKSIERPEQAFDVVQSLRDAPALAIDYLRDGKRKQLTIPIADE